MNQAPVILAIVPSKIEHSAAIRRAAEMARLSGGRLHLCVFVFDGLIGTEIPRSHVAELACRAFVAGFDAELRKLAAELAHPQFSIECEALWAPVPHETIMAKALAIGADCVVKDVRQESVLRRMLFTPLDWKLIRLLPCDLMLVGPDSPPRPERVLAAVDVLAEDPQIADSLNDRIVASARTLAEYSNAGLDLASVMPWFPLSTRSTHSSKHYDEMVMQHLKAMRSFAERLKLPAKRCHRPLGVPAEAIVKIAEELTIDITVVGNFYRNGWERLLLGSTAETLLQQLRSDLLVVKPRDFALTAQKHIDLEAIRRRVALEQPGQSQPESD